MACRPLDYEELFIAPQRRRRRLNEEEDRFWLDCARLIANGMLYLFGRALHYILIEHCFRIEAQMARSVSS